MNINKFQKKMFDRLISGERVVYAEMPDEQIMLTNGFEAYIFFKKEICLNLDACQKINDAIKIAEPNETDRELELTDIFYNAGGKMCRQLKSKDGMKIWAQDSFLKPLNGCAFKGNLPSGRILAYDAHKRLISVIMPIRVEVEESHEKESN